MSDRKVTSELLSSVCEGTGYDEIYPLGRELKEDFPRSPKREPSTHSPNDEEEDEEAEEGDEENDKGDEYDEGDKEEKGDEEDEGGEEDEGDRSKGVEEAGQVDGGARPFILPLIWTVDDFNPTMSDKVFNTLRDHYQIPENIPICLLVKCEKCYSERTTDVGMYDAMFTAGLRLLLTDLHRRLANYLGLSISLVVRTIGLPSTSSFIATSPSRFFRLRISTIF